MHPQNQNESKYSYSFVPWQNQHFLQKVVTEMEYDLSNTPIVMRRSYDSDIGFGLMVLVPNERVGQFLFNLRYVDISFAKTSH
jgi:hypothetical protein